MVQELINTALLAYIEASGLTRDELARRCEVNAKSIWMWTHRGQTPHMRTQLLAATALGVGRTRLWPETSHQAAIASAAEQVADYVNRGQVPADLWTGLARRATQRICVAVYAGLLWFESSPGLLDVLKDRADNGVKVNIALGDPASPAVQVRGQDEGINMSARIQNTMKFIEPVIGYPGIEIRQHGTTLHNSMYIFDDVMLVNTHIYGVPACSAPVRHFQRFSSGSYFDLYQNSFERIWSQTQPGL